MSVLCMRHEEYVDNDVMFGYLGETDRGICVFLCLACFIPPSTPWFEFCCLYLMFAAVLKDRLWLNFCSIIACILHSPAEYY